MTAKIVIHGSMSQVKGSVPLKQLREATSYEQEGHQFSQAFRKKIWDGRVHLMSRNGVFPTGLLDQVEAVLREHQVEYEVEDNRTPQEGTGTFELDGVKFEFPYEYQLEAAKTMVEQRCGIVKIATNGGKCLGPEVLVRMFDGTTKLARDVVVGDKLMGPDGSPRNVLSTCRGVGPLFRVNQKRGMSYVCNDVHVLTLQDCRKKFQNRIVDIPLNEYLEEDNYFKHCFKHFSVGVEYPERPVAVDPYFVGLWLGDGTKALKTVSVTTEDTEIVDYLTRFAGSWGCRLSEDDHRDNASSTYHLSANKQPNHLLGAMRALFDTGLRIPEEYLVNSRAVRLALLAGLLDSDGHYQSNKSTYEITLKQRRLIDDVYMLCRSLGFGVAPPVEKVVTLSDGRELTYWRLHIRGIGPSAGLPVLLDRKKPVRESKKCATRTSFAVTPIGEGEYAGFTLDGDGRFLLADYTVTHNTEIACSVTNYLRQQTLFCVTTRELLYQAQKRFMKRLGVGEDVVGLIGDGHWQPGSWVTIATVDTLMSRKNTDECQQLLANTRVLFLDEAHHLGSETWYDLSCLCAAVYRFGLSGTPLDRSDGADLRLIAATGPIIVNIENKFLVDRGISARANIIWDRVAEPVLKNLTYAEAYKQGVAENEHLEKKVIEWTKVLHKAGLSTLVLVEHINHGKRLDDALWACGEFVPHAFINGKEDTTFRTNMLEQFARRELPVLIASTILDEGVDVPTIDALILAGSRKSRIKTMQRLGRGLRGKKLIVVEFANFCNKHLLKHSMERYEDYKEEECFPIYQSGPDLELVRRLWGEDPTS